MVSTVHNTDKPAHFTMLWTEELIKTLNESISLNDKIRQSNRRSEPGVNQWSFFLENAFRAMKRQDCQG